METISDWTSNWWGSNGSHLIIPRKGMETHSQQLSNKYLLQSHLIIPRKGMETRFLLQLSNVSQKVAPYNSPQGDGNEQWHMYSGSCSLSHLIIPRKGMETFFVFPYVIDLRKSHLIIPRKGMETWMPKLFNWPINEVAPYNSPQGDGNTNIQNCNLLLLGCVAPYNSPQGDGNYQRDVLNSDIVVPSHLIIPRKGMETSFEQLAPTFILVVAPYNSPQGDGNSVLPSLEEAVVIVAPYNSPQGDGNTYYIAIFHCFD